MNPDPIFGSTLRRRAVENCLIPHGYPCEWTEAIIERLDTGERLADAVRWAVYTLTDTVIIMCTHPECQRRINDEIARNHSIDTHHRLFVEGGIAGNLRDVVTALRAIEACHGESYHRIIGYSCEGCPAHQPALPSGHPDDLRTMSAEQVRQTAIRVFRSWAERSYPKTVGLLLYDMHRYWPGTQIVSNELRYARHYQYRGTRYVQSRRARQRQERRWDRAERQHRAIETRRDYIVERLSPDGREQLPNQDWVIKVAGDVDDYPVIVAIDVHGEHIDLCVHFPGDSPPMGGFITTFEIHNFTPLLEVPEEEHTIKALWFSPIFGGIILKSLEWGSLVDVFYSQDGAEIIFAIPLNNPARPRSKIYVHISTVVWQQTLLAVSEELTVS